MNYMINSDVACAVGVNGAIILGNIYYWCKHNEANKKNEFDGRHWTFNSVPAFCEMFPFMSRRTIERELKKLKDEGYLLTGCYNKSHYDKTNWYAMSDKTMALFEGASNEFGNNERQIDSVDTAKTAQTIPPNWRDGQCQTDADCDKFTVIDTAKNEGIDTAKLARPIPKYNTDNTKPKSTKKRILSGRPDDAQAAGAVVSKVVDYLNEKAGTSYKATTPKTQQLIVARVKEGFTLADFKTVIDKKVAEWGSDGEMVQYLRPLTLFSTKFESYLNQQSARGKPKDNTKRVTSGAQSVKDIYADALAILTGGTDNADTNTGGRAETQAIECDGEVVPPF